MSALRKCLVLAIAALLGPPARPALAEGPSVKLTPEVIRMGAFYSGEWMRISGTASPDSKVIVVLRGPRTEEVFNRKGRAGPIWINIGKVHISGVPSLFLCYSSEPVDSLLNRDEIERRQLDDQAIRRQMVVTPQEMDHEAVRRDYIALKTEERVYRMISDGLKMGPPGGGGVPYSVNFHWPRKAPPALYEVRVYECRNGALIGRATAQLHVIKVGFPAALAALATEHASMYGIGAVLIAALGGFGIDFLVSLLRRRLGRSSVSAPPPAVAEKEGERLGKSARAH